jgi:hypothetical protein
MLLGRLIQDFARIPGNNIFEEPIPNQLSVKILKDSENKFSGLELIQRGDFEFNASFHGNDVVSVLQNIYINIEKISCKVKDAYKIESTKST